MNRNRVEDFGSYQDGVLLFDYVVTDMAILQKDPRCCRLIARLTKTINTLRENNPRR